MSKRLLIVCCLALLPVAALAQSYTAVLTGAAEAPNAGDPDGVGVALITIEGTTIRYNIAFRNIGANITGAHIHRNPAGVAGQVVVGFDINSLGNGVVENVSPTLINEIVSNPSNFYVNVHTSQFPGGAIRGQLMPAVGAMAGAEFLPVVGRVTGAAGTNFVTDVRIINHSSQTASVTLDFFRQSESGLTAPTVSRTISIGAGEQRVLNDIIGFLGADGLGGLRVTSDQDIDVRARVINDLRETGEGTTGFSVEAGDLGRARTSGTLGFLSAASSADIGAGIGWRTNIGYFNPTDRTVTVTFTARDADDGSVLGTRTVTVPPFAFAQQGAFALINTVPVGDQVQDDFYVTWTAEGGPLFVYAAVVDNRTGDAVMIQ